MKHICLTLSALAGLFLLGACQKGQEVSQEESSRTITITADSDVTKTLLSDAGSTYSVSWQTGDKIRLIETIYANFQEGVQNDAEDIVPVKTYESAGLAADAAKAAFPVSLSTRKNPKSDKYRYVAVYPASGSIMSTGIWTGQSSYTRTDWEDLFSQDSSFPDHSYLMLSIPTYQKPTPTSFDPDADLLVSELLTSDTPIGGEVKMKFARIGTILDVTLSGLPAGSLVKDSRLEFNPTDWGADYMILYDPELGKVTLKGGKSAGEMYIAPAGVYADESGKAHLWLRAFSGRLTDWFSFKAVVEVAGGEQTYYKKVDLNSLGKVIEFPESGLTRFGVGLQRLYNISMAKWTLSATANSFDYTIQYSLDGAPTEGMEIGVLEAANYDEVWNLTLETAAPEKIVKLTPIETPAGAPADKVYCRYTRTGLTPKTTYWFRNYVKLSDGSVYYGNSVMSVITAE